MRFTLIFMCSILLLVSCGKMQGAKINANEQSTIAALRAISTSQAMFQMMGADKNDNGIGEYGYLQELAKNSDFIAKITAEGKNGIGTKNGYHFYIYLPHAEKDFSDAIGEKDMANEVTSFSLRESGFICYAWPVEYGKTGNRAFVVNETMEVLICDNKDGMYSGDKKPAANAALDKEIFKLLSGKMGHDGQVWKTQY